MFLAAFLALAAQPQTAPATPPQSIDVPLSQEVSMTYQQAADAMGTCWERQIAALPPGTTPEAGGIAVEAACAAQTARLEQIAIANVNADTRSPQEAKNFAIARIQQSMQAMDLTIAQLIRTQRASAASTQ